MKKEYIKPLIEVVKVNMSCQILAGSDRSVTGVAGNGGFSLGNGSSSGGRSRDCDDWDEE
jgi:uncharacterized membrane protein YgcG